MFLVPLPRSSSFNDSALRSPSLDVAETDSAYNVSLDLPGVIKDDVKVTIDGRHVSVSANSQRDETKPDGGRLIYRERSASSFARRFTLPEAVDQDSSQARLENGVLTLALAKKRVVAAKPLTIN
jgi:HSP20 family protein